MAPLTSVERLQEAFSLALEDRSRGYADLVSNANALLTVMRQKNQFQTFSGPTIRERLLYNESGSYIRYQGFENLNPKPVQLFNDAEFTPKLAAVSVTLSGEDILKNSGTNQLKDIMAEHINAAEKELEDRFVEDLHSDGTASGGKQIGGLQLVLPTDPTTGTYGGISRADNAIWRTTSVDIDTVGWDLDGSTDTQVNSENIHEIYSRVVEQISRGRNGPDIILASSEHYHKFLNATKEIQRITNESSRMAQLGFPAVKFAGVGKTIDVVLEGGIGSAMPSNVTYFIDSSALKFRYHPDRNFGKFGGKQMPINQDAVVQHIGFFGELTMNNPLHMAKLYDSDTAS